MQFPVFASGKIIRVNLNLSKPPWLVLSELNSGKAHAILSASRDAGAAMVRQTGIICSSTSKPGAEAC